MNSDNAIDSICDSIENGMFFIKAPIDRHVDDDFFEIGESVFLGMFQDSVLFRIKDTKTLSKNFSIKNIKKGETIRLPYFNTCIEFLTDSEALNAFHGGTHTRCIALATEILSSSGEIAVNIFAEIDSDEYKWALVDMCSFSTTAGLYFSKKTGGMDFYFSRKDYPSPYNCGPLPVLFVLDSLSRKKNIKKHKKNASNQDTPSAISSDGIIECIISCSDLKIRSARGNNIVRCSPREHFRRGHVRHIKHGNVWINPTTVNEGKGGRIEKTYIINNEE